tara:strand:- start:1248 stop:1901 length:654 start_codon:yes stop_codon:yes gene_type:complete
VSRLFITPREIDFIADLTKEITKDVMGQKIYYYHVREDLTDVHDVYEESANKIFDPPIEIEAFVDWQPEEIRTNRFGHEEFSTIEVRIQSRDLIDREIDLKEGDYFSYGELFFEITSLVALSNVFGQVEYTTGFKVVGKQARKGQIEVAPIGPTSEARPEDDAVQQEFVQQRGEERNKLGETGDRRELREDGKLEKPLSGPQEVRKDGISSSFYGDD